MATHRLSAAQGFQLLTRAGRDGTGHNAFAGIRPF